MELFGFTLQGPRCLWDAPWLAASIASCSALIVLKVLLFTTSKFGSFLDQKTTLVEHTTQPTRNADGFPVDSVSKGLNLSWPPCYYLKVIDLSMMFVKTDQVCCHLHDCFAEVVLW